MNAAMPTTTCTLDALANAMQLWSPRGLAAYCTHSDNVYFTTKVDAKFSHAWWQLLLTSSHWNSSYLVWSHVTSTQLKEWAFLSVSEMALYIAISRYVLLCPSTPCDRTRERPSFVLRKISHEQIPTTATHNRRLIGWQPTTFTWRSCILATNMVILMLKVSWHSQYKRVAHRYNTNLVRNTQRYRW